MLTIEDKVELLLSSSADMKRADLIKMLKRYRGWELAEIAAYLGGTCSINAPKTVSLQIVLKHLLSYEKVGVS